MGSLAEDIAVIRTHVEYMRERADKSDAADKERDAAILELKAGQAELKSARKTDRAVAAAVGAVVAFLFSHADKISKVLALFTCMALLTACAEFPVGSSQWLSRDVTVLVDPRLPEQCQAAVDDAEIFWRHNGVTYLSFQSGDTSGWEYPNAPKDHILIRPDSPVKPDVAGDAYPRLYANDHSWIHDASIRLRHTNCTTNVVAHEIGHSLGLEHDGFKSNLMYWIALGGMELTEAQRAWVR